MNPGKRRKILSHSGTEHLAQQILGVPHGHVVRNVPSVMLQAKVNRRENQCHAIDHIADMAQFRSGSFKKLSARRDVEKNISDLNRRSHRRRAGARCLFAPAIDPEPLAGCRRRRARA